MKLTTNIEINYSELQGKAIVFYDVRYDVALIWHDRGDEEETAEVIRAWTAIQVPAVGLYTGCSDGEFGVVPFEGYTEADLKRYLTICELSVPPGAKLKCFDEDVLYTRVNSDREV